MNDSSSLKNRGLGQLLANIYLPLSAKIPLFGPKKKVIVIAGPTGVGKTELSLHLARLVGGEIVSADSVQVYRGMDIGSAKVSSKIRQNIPHHLIDVVDLYEPFNVANYFAMAKEAIDAISRRGNVPIVIGGSGFYIQSILYGPPPGPKSDPVLRARLERQMEKIGCAAMYEQLQLVDPDYAATITENDRHKIIRALEIMTIAEKKVSDFVRPKTIRNDTYDFRLWFLYYPLETLYHKLEKRCIEMLDGGLLDEVCRLKKQGIENNSVAAKAIGYKQCLEFLTTKMTPEDFDWLVYTFKKASRHFAKRQFTWFRKELDFRRINLEKMDDDRVTEMILQDYEQC